MLPKISRTDAETIRPTPERMQHGELRAGFTRENRRAYQDVVGFPLDYLADRSIITAQQLDDGLYYHGLYLGAGRSRSGVMRYEREDIRSGGDGMGAARAGRECRDLERAILADMGRHGPRAVSVLILVAGECEYPSLDYRDYSRPLRDALSVIARERIVR